MKKQINRHLFKILAFILTLAITSCGNDNDDSGGDNRSNLPRKNDDSGGDNLVRKPPIYMWVSTSVTNADIGGYYNNGANEICINNATAIEFHTKVMSHQALLSGPGQDARTLFGENDDRPVKRPDNTPIIDSYRNFFDPSKELQNSIGTGEIYYFTGVKSDGSPADKNASCDNWQTDNGSTHVGRIDQTNYSRLNDGTGKICDSINRILCVSG